jgi:hypothetical protein
MVHKLPEGSGEPSDRTNEWLAYGFVFLLVSPIICLIGGRVIGIAWCLLTCGLLGMGTIGGLI